MKSVGKKKYTFVYGVRKPFKSLIDELRITHDDEFDTKRYAVRVMHYIFTAQTEKCKGKRKYETFVNLIRHISCIY